MLPPIIPHLLLSIVQYLYFSVYGLYFTISNIFLRHMCCIYLGSPVSFYSLNYKVLVKTFHFLDIIVCFVIKDPNFHKGCTKKKEKKIVASSEILNT